MSRPVSIHSDGTDRGTIVLNESGEPIDGLSGLTFSMNAGEQVDIELRVNKASSMTVAGDVTTVAFECPLCYTTHEHRCDDELGGTLVGKSRGVIMVTPPQCGERLNNNVNPCIMNEGHVTGSIAHFNGRDVWA